MAVRTTGLDEADGARSEPGRLVLAATPLGHARDASARLVEALATADVVAAEDTRRVRALAAALEVRIGGRVISHYDAVEAARLPGLLDDVAAGRHRAGRHRRRDAGGLGPRLPDRGRGRGRAGCR